MNSEIGINNSNPLSHNPLDGLNNKEVVERREKFGENVLPTEKMRSAWSIFFAQFKSPLIYIILAAAMISLFTKGIPENSYEDFVIIMVVVIIDAVLGFIQEYQAQRTYTALRTLLRPTTTVIREDQRQEIDVVELVPGDIVLLNAGEKVPGDGNLLESTKITVDEAILTGESEPVNKSEVSDQNQVFMGTTVLTGRGFMEVTGTGIHTELGKIATSLGEPSEQETPLQVRLKAFSKTLTFIVIGFTAVIFTVGLLLSYNVWEMLRTSIILAIAAVPEGLLIAVTVILVLGMRKILKRNALVKHMLAVETLGSVTVICTDKTGTLTEGRMRVTQTNFEDEEHALQTMVLCNDLEGPVDLALWEYAKAKLKFDPQDIIDGSQRHSEELFTSETKYMITESTFEGHSHFFMKGAPEIILEMCKVEEDLRQEVLSTIDSWAASGLRTLGLAYRSGGTLENRSNYMWVGLIGMEDPLREGVIDAIKIARHAGIYVKMITGDYRLTAERIAKNIGILTPDQSFLEGEALAQLDDEELKKRVIKTAVFARIHPQDKLRIVRALQANGEITAMIGDGVNDAPALKRANIGVVVGSATDVAKETADVVLMDNNFRTIVAAVEEGRIIFENIRKVVAYTLSNSFAEVLTIFISMLFKWPAPLTVAQILWIHLICDGPSDIVLGFEPKEHGIMDEKPKSIKEPILAPLGLILIAVISISSAITALLVFSHFHQLHNDALGQSMVFASFGINSMIYIFAYRSMRQPIYKMPKLRENRPLIWAVLTGLAMVFVAFLIPGLRNVLGIVPLTWQEWTLIISISIGLLLIVEIGKELSKKLHGKKV
jgi:Ca2+-transporting ATPase